MDYFFWDEIFGNQRGPGELLYDGPPADDEAPATSELYSVIIACREPYCRPPAIGGN